MAPLSFVLTRPQMGENIGAAARVMANFGLSQLALVAPRDGWPNVKASDTAGKALYMLDDATLHTTVEEAVAGVQFVLATTSRDRAVNIPVLDAREAMAQAHARVAAGQRVAVLFGPERTGLENEELALANAVVSLPVADTYPSLNLAQAVAVMAYEFRCQVSGVRGQEKALEPPAPKAELEGLFGQLEAALDSVNFWRVPEKKEGMWRNIRASLVRSDMTSQEIATWRGIVRAFADK